MLIPLRDTFGPNRVLVRIEEAAIPSLAKRMPPLAGKKCKDGKTTAYVCRGPVCSAPMTRVSELRAELKSVIAYGR